MEPTVLITIFLTILIFGAIGAAVMLLRGGDQGAGSMRELMSGGGQMDSDRKRPGEDQFLDIDEIKLRSGHSQLKKRKEDINQKLFKAGVYAHADRQRFAKIRLILPIVLVPLFGLIGALSLGGTMWSLTFALIGGFAGYAGPITHLERRARAREEDTLYFLPLVIEQISIGVSSSLDVGPCIAEVVRMADERDSHNPVTEMFVHSEKLMRSGLNLEEALVEVSEVNGQMEVKHAFMFLAQCSKHGGEVSKQLQELADATMTQRQTYVEGRIAALPVKATGPLAVVFAGFFGILFAGLMVRLFDAFGGGVGTG